MNPPRMSDALVGDSFASTFVKPSWVSQQTPSSSSDKAPAANVRSQFIVYQLVVVIFFYLFAISLTNPVLPIVWKNTPVGGGDIDKGASLYQRGISINAACEFLSAAFLGAVSDRYGRKPVLLLATAGQVIDFGFAALAARSNTDDALSLEDVHVWLFAARMVAGLCGNMMVFAKACIVDVSAPEDKARNFALVSATWGLAQIVGNPLGAYLSKEAGDQCPLLVSATLNITVFFWLLMLEETLAPEHRKPIELRKANPIGGLSFLLSGRFLGVFGAMNFLDQFSLSMLSSFLFSFADSKFKVPRTLASTLMVVIGAGQCAVNFLLVPPLVKRYGELLAVKLGYVITCFSYACFAMVSYFGEFWMLYPVLVVFDLGAISQPAQNAAASRSIAPDEQGRLQVAVGALDVVGKMTSSALVGLVWKPAAEKGHHGIVWLLACAILVPGVCMAFRLPALLPARFFEGGVHGRLSEVAGMPRDDGATAREVCADVGTIELGDRAGQGVVCDMYADMPRQQ